MIDVVENLKQAIIGESNAKRKYEHFAEKAGSENHPEIANLFKAISFAESIHIKNHLKALTKITNSDIDLNDIVKIDEEELKKQVNDTRSNLIQSIAGETFEFKFDVTYYTGDEPFGLEEDESEKIFDIIVEYPTGWIAAASPGFETKEITAIKLKSLKTESLKVFAAPLVKQEPGEYDIKITIKSNVEDDKLEGATEFKAIITATYELDLRTKTGRLSTEITSGKDNHYKLILENKGSTSIENISLSSTEPEGWQVDFDEDKIEILESEEKKEIDVTINPPEKTIAGDYMLSFRVSSENSNDDIELRVTVETPTIWGIVGIGIIVVVIIGVAVIFARLGRR